MLTAQASRLNLKAIMKKEYIIGVDDAGRGPVLGSMFIAGTLFDKDADAILKKMGVKDSKMLFPSVREKLAVDIKKLALSYEVIKITPSEIDEAVISGFNLNKLEANKMAQVINALTDALEKDAKITVYVDCPSNNIPAWKSVLLSYINRKEMDFKVEHKCDVNHVECSAASVLAKVTRDEEVKKIKKQYNVNCGSGYPSDPVCVEFLKTKGAKKLEEKGLIRKSWQTWKNHKKDEEQKMLF
jgi:ribonuclease HII